MKILNRTQKLKLNTVTSLANQIVLIVCGFVVPVLILHAFGSAVNGLVNSITQFLGFISLLELGVGAVVQSALYKPLADKDNASISRIYVSANRFFRMIAIILLVYIVLLMLFYPAIVSSEFDWLFSASLIGCIAISLFAQYYFGVVNTLLLNSDQRSYVQNIISVAAQILNVAACVVLINFGCGIHAVKLVASLIFLLRPLGMAWYVKKNYDLSRNISYQEEPIKQKWNGIAQHFASVVLSNTDVVVLTLFSTLTNVSIYSVYNLVVSGLKQMIFSMMSGIQALMGELWAKQQLSELNKLFGWVEWLMHTGAVAVWGCTVALIVPFVQVYTAGINDADYVVPLFAMLISYAHMGHCLRLPYNLMILVGGHYRETQSNYIVAAVMNIVISVLAVHAWGLIGVALGTICAMFYQTFWMANYISKNLLKWPIKCFLKQFFVDLISLVLIYKSTAWIELGDVSYFAWGIMALKVVLVAFVGLLAVNIIFYKANLIALWNKIKT